MNIYCMCQVSYLRRAFHIYEKAYAVYIRFQMQIYAGKCLIYGMY